MSDVHSGSIAGSSVATLYEAAGRTGALPHDLRPILAGVRLAGPAFTVRCVPGDNLAIHRAVAEAAPASVLVVDAGGDQSGYWGEVLTVAAQARGLAGLVIDGGVRDVERLRALGWPTWCRFISIIGTTKREPGELRVPIPLGPTVINPEDLIVADDDGVVAIESIRVDEVLAAARLRDEHEAELFARLREGALTVDLLGLRPGK